MSSRMTNHHSYLLRNCSIRNHMMVIKDQMKNYLWIIIIKYNSRKERKQVVEKRRKGRKSGKSTNYQGKLKRIVLGWRIARIPAILRMSPLYTRKSQRLRRFPTKKTLKICLSILNYSSSNILKRIMERKMIFWSILRKIRVSTRGTMNGCSGCRSTRRCCGVCSMRDTLRGRFCYHGLMVS